MNKNKGFTLIELLVVIAIIGILSSVVLASLTSSRIKAQTAAFKSEITALHPALVSACNDEVLAGDNVAILAAGKHLLGTINSGSADTECGSAGSGTFSVTYLASSDGLTAGTVGTCTDGTVTETGATFNVGC